MTHGHARPDARRIVFLCLVIIASLFGLAASLSYGEEPADKIPAEKTTSTEKPQAEPAAETPPDQDPAPKSASTDNPPPASEAEAEKSPSPPESDKPESKESPAKESADQKSDTGNADAEKTDEPRLRFNFRYQRWIDVLQWVAQQADLSLVLDAPPPGTFNYSDTREYTPTEAIDLLNGVLLTKGYSLVRRDRMLLVLNLKKGIPEGLVPRVPLEELDKRGKFELVTVLFPLGRRNATEVSTEISPLLGPHGKAVPLAKTNQLLVTDTAGIMRAISAVISSIPEPTPEPKKEETKPPEPVLVVYPVEKADPTVATEVLTKLLPNAKVVLDPKAQQINVHGTPSEQMTAKTVLEQMQTHDPPEKQPRLEVYPCNEEDSTRLLATLQTMTPEATISLDPKTGHLIAWATPEDQATLKEGLEKLAAGGSLSEGKRQVAVYPLEKVDPNTMLTLLQNLLPQARLAIDSQTRSLIAVAAPADQEAIKNILDRLEPKPTDQNQPELRVHRLSKPASPTLLPALQSLVPRAQITVDPNGKRLTVVARPLDHETIQANLAKLEATEEEPRKLVVYPVTEAQRKRFQAVLPTVTAELPGIQVITDAEPGELSIWAQPSQHEVLKGILDELRREVPPDKQYQLAVYPIQSADPSTVVSTLQTLFPGTQIVLDAKSRRVMVWTRPDRQKTIKSAIEAMDSGPPGAAQEKFMVYPLPGATLSVGLNMLRQLVPDAQLMPDYRADTVVAFARPADHEVIARAIEEMQAGPGAEYEPKPVVYPITVADPNAVLTVLRAMAPSAQVVLDNETGSLVATALPKEHDKIKATIEQLDKEHAEGQAPRLQVHRLAAADTSSVYLMLQRLFRRNRDIEISSEPTSGAIVAVASPADQEEIASVIAELDKEAGETGAKTEVYAVDPQESFGLLRLLQNTLPNARFSMSANRRKLIAWARPTDQKTISGIIERVQAEESEETAPTLAMYTIKSIAPQVAIQALRSIVPEAFSTMGTDPNKLLVWARPEEHKEIQAFIKKLEAEGEAQPGQTLAVYPMKPDASQSFMQLVDPNLKARVRLIPDAARESLIVWADPKDQETIRAAVEEFNTNLPEPKEPVSQVYRLQVADPTTLLTVLRSLVPEARLAVDNETGSLVASALPEDQEKIKATVEQLDQKHPEGQTPRLQVHRLTAADANSVNMMLQRLFRRSRDIEISADPDSGAIVAVASPADQEEIAGVIAELDKEAAETGAKTKVYTINPQDSYGLWRLLQNTLPKARFSLSADQRKLIAWARPADQETISGIIEQVQTEGAGETAQTLAVYPMKPDSGQAFLQLVDPNLKARARLIPDEARESLIVWADPKDQETIRAAVEEFNKNLPEPKEPVSRVYQLQVADPTTLLTVLRSLVPEARVAADAETGSLVASALPEDHEKIKATVEQLDQKHPEGQTPRLQVHRLEAVDANSVNMMLQRLFRRSRDIEISADPDSGAIVAVASPADQEEIASVIAELDKEAAETGAKTEVYAVDPGDALGTLRLLQSAFPNGRFSLSADSQKLIAWARPTDQETVAGIIKRMQEKNPEEEPFSKAYFLQTTEPQSAAVVLRSLVPRATVAVNPDNRSIVASALPEDHEKIRQAVEQMDGEEAQKQAPRLEAHPVGSADPNTLLTMFERLFYGRRDVQLSVDEENDAVLAVATPKDHETIRRVIQEVEQGGAESPTVRVHPLKNIDATAALEVLENLFARQHPTVELSTSPRGDHLVAIARPEQHAMIEATLKQLQTEELDVEIFQLERIDPYTAETAIVSLFSENFWDAPMVEVDMNMQQLFVRAKREQLDQIRELLVKMGETQLAAASQTRKNVRVVPFQGDTEAALTEIRRVWPSLRKNTIRVLEPSEPPKAPPEPGEKPATPPPPKKPPNSASTTTPAVQMVSFQEAKQAGPSEKPKASENQENTKNADNAESPHKSEIKEKSESSQPLPKPAEPAPVIVVPGEGSITIASDDPEALRQMEALLRGLSQGTPTHGGRNHSIFVLQHADATEVAETLQQLFKTQPGRYRRREIVPTLIVANEQLNAVVVHGNRADREEIGKLVEVFDTPELAAALRPTMIPIENTKAERIEEVVREVFRAEFGFGRGRGMGSRQAQLAVDEMTNSLVVMARGPLVEEVTRLAQSLDEAAGKSPARSLKIISLKNTNATRIEEALDTLLQDSIRRYRRRY